MDEDTAWTLLEVSSPMQTQFAKEHYLTLKLFFVIFWRYLSKDIRRSRLKRSASSSRNKSPFERQPYIGSCLYTRGCILHPGGWGRQGQRVGGVIFTELFSSRERISSNRVRVKVFDVICLTLFVGSLVMCNTILIGVVDREKRTQYFFSSASVQLGALWWLRR